MRISGEATVGAPVSAVWDALLDPNVLVRTIPGCERLETTGENAYDMTVNVGVAAIRGTYAGTCRLSDLQPHESLRLAAQGTGAPGTIDADVRVTLSGEGEQTTLSYDADAVVGGMIGGVGQRMLSSVSRRLAGEFFAAVEREITAPAGAPAEAEAAEVTAAAGTRTTGEVFTAPPRPGTAFSQRDFLSGVAVGAGLVALGVVLGSVSGRRR
jgi:uncharacterized protein